MPGCDSPNPEDEDDALDTTYTTHNRFPGEAAPLADGHARDGEAPAPAARLLTADEAASYLAVSRTTLYRLMKHEGMPSLHLGTLRRFDRHALDRWVDARSVA